MLVLPNYASTIYRQKPKGDDKEIGKKWYVYIITNNNFARASRYFVHFFAVVAPLRQETS